MVSQLPEAACQNVADGLIWRNQICRGTRRVLDCDVFILFLYADQDEECRNHFYPLSLTCTNKRTKIVCTLLCKEHSTQLETEAKVIMQNRSRKG